jgi:hypothetical protein
MNTAGPGLFNSDGLKNVVCAWCHSSLTYYGTKNADANGTQTAPCPVCGSPNTFTNQADDVGVISTLFGNGIALEWNLDTVEVTDRKEPAVSWAEYARTHPVFAQNISKTLGTGSTNAHFNLLTLFRTMIGADPITGELNGKKTDWIFWSIVIAAGGLTGFILYKRYGKK